MIALAAMVMAALMISTEGSPLLLVISIGLLITICIGALCEPPSLVPSVYRPFVKRGLAGKLIGRFLYPGWQSGVLFSLVVLLILLAALHHEMRAALNPMRFWWVIVSIAGALFMPAALSHAFLQRWRRPVVIYVVIQGICAMIAAVAGMLEGFKVVDLRPAVAMIPTTGLLLATTEAITNRDMASGFIGTIIVTGASLLVLLVKMRKPWREIHALEKLAATMPSLRSPDASDPRAAE